MKEKIRKCETRMCKVVFPNTLNANQTLFGGLVMQWMDEVAFIAATRFTRQKVFTVNVENIRFLKPVPENSIVELIGWIEDVSPAKLKVKVCLYIDSKQENHQEKAMEAAFIMAALNDEMRPVRLESRFLKMDV